MMLRIGKRRAVVAEMSRVAQGQKRPADTIGCAVMVAKIATGEIEERAKAPLRRCAAGKLAQKPVRRN